MLVDSKVRKRKSCYFNKVMNLVHSVHTYVHQVVLAFSFFVEYLMTIGIYVLSYTNVCQLAVEFQTENHSSSFDNRFM